jgi:2,3-bisphosphoglycerate-dependent phosphoglycerate mutase
VPVPLTSAGEDAARRLGQQLAAAAFDVCVHTRFDRTRRTAELALAGRDVPFLVEPGLDDVRIGELDGGTVEDYRAWKAAHGRAERFPGGDESLVEVAHRYAAALRRVVELPAESVLVVCHELPVRYALNAAAGSSELDRPLHDIPNATPYLFDADVLAAAADRIELLAD